ncbi:MAG: FAD-dependent oxidoreductase [Cyanobacteria bacterium Co-bin13]|nr:FAD-dependent oxidoreductase [Cyanobacteria bacterium Co-bin13]
MQDAEIVVIGSGIGGLVAAGLLARYGRQVIVCESHSVPGGAAHDFTRGGFRFDSGPSFYCGLGDPNSLNPVRQVLAALGESIEAIPYDPLGYYHLPEGTLPIYGKGEQYRDAIAQFSPRGARELADLEQRFLKLYEALRGVPLLALRSDWQLLPLLLRHCPQQLLKLLPQIPLLGASAGQVLDQCVRDPWVRRLFDLECFLLSGLKAHETVAPEMAFMFGERHASVVDYPLGGSGAIIAALVRGLERWGGELRLNAHVDQILVESDRVAGVRLRHGEVLRAPIVISNATVWDTLTQLLKPEEVPVEYRQSALQTPAVDSFMHLHLGIRSEGLDDLAIHHVVVHEGDRDLSEPGNTCMISIPSVLDPSLAPPGHHVIHAYTLEPWTGWRRDPTYKQRKRERAEPLYRALERVIPDLRLPQFSSGESRVVLELIGTPLTHQRYLRRYRGTYGPAIAAGQGVFPGCATPIAGLYRVGDSTRPGIGVPAVAASGILCANSLVSAAQVSGLVSDLAAAAATARR